MGWDNNSNKKIENLTVTRDIIGVSEVTTNELIQGFAVLSNTEHTNNSWKGNKDNVKNLSFSQETIRLAVGDAYYLYAKYPATVGTQRSDAYMNDDSTFGGDNGFTLRSSNETVLSTNGNVLYPQSVGSASVQVLLGNQIIGVAYVNVVAERYLDPESVKVDIPKRNLSTADNDSITVKVTAKDQLGEDITPAIDQVTISDTSLISHSINGNEVTFKATSAVSERKTVSILLKIYAGSNKNIYRQYSFGITVNKIEESIETKNANSFNVWVKNGELDMKLGKDKQTSEIVLEGLKDGFHLYTYDSTNFIPVKDQSEIAKTTDGKLAKGVYVQVTNGGFNGKDRIKNGMFYSLIATDTNGGVGNATVSGGAVSVSGAAIKANTGTYIVRVYVVQEDGMTPRIVTTSFTVKDSTNIAANVKKSTVNGIVTEDNVSNLINSVELKIDGWKEIKSGDTHDGITYTITGCKLANTSSLDSYFVTSIIVTTSKNGMETTYEVPVNRLFKKQ